MRLSANGHDTPVDIHNGLDHIAELAISNDLEIGASYRNADDGRIGHEENLPGAADFPHRTSP
jgi:hypothetical protein